MLDAFRVVALSSAAAGTFDLVAACLAATKRGMTVETLLQFVASGALGEKAFEGGKQTAIAGVFFHFLIAALWALAYFVLSVKLPILLTQPFLYGALFGALVHIIMSFIVLPVSRTPKRPFDKQAWLAQLVIHIVCVGLPIALVQAALNQTGT